MTYFSYYAPIVQNYDKKIIHTPKCDMDSPPPPRYIQMYIRKNIFGGSRTFKCVKTFFFKPRLIQNDMTNMFRGHIPPCTHVIARGP